MEEAEKVISAYNLWKSDLMTTEDFYSTLVKIRGNTPLPNSAIKNEMTQGQRNYIAVLIKEGKLQNKEYHLTKQEAQILIKEAVEGKIAPVNICDKAVKEVFDGITNRVDDELKSLFEGGDNY